MNYFKFIWTKTLNTSILCLKITGPLPINTTTRFYRKLSTLYSVLVPSFFIVVSMVLQTVQTVFFTRDAKTFANSTFRIIQEFQIVVKMYCVFKKSQNLKMIFHFLNNEESFQPTTRKQTLLVVAALNLWKKNSVLLCGGAYMCCLLWTVYPVIDTSDDEINLIFESWYPFNAKVYPWYQIAYVYQCLDLWMGAVFVVNIDSVIYALMIFVALQCDFLCEDLKNIGRYDGNGIDGNFFRCVQHHKNILRFSKMCVDFFYFMVFIQVATISLCIGISMFQLTLVHPFSTEFYSVLFYVVTVIFQIFQYCWFGNEVLVKSSKISTSAFEMNFIDAPLHVRKNLAFFITRTQRPIKIPVLNLTFLSLQTFIKILRTAWSYFALLYQLSIKN